MRRVVVTPTFAAGLGVVVAAVLAYPMQTVFSYVAPGASGSGGIQCGQGGCAHQAGHGKPAPFGVGGGVLNPAPPGSATPDNEGGASPSGQRPGGSRAVVQPQLSYKIISEWPGGFWGQLIVTFPGAVPPEWRLRLGYPGGHILGMNPNSHLAPNGHAVTVRSSDYPGGMGPGGRTFAIGIGVQGRPTRPARCSFDGQACHIG
jgi:Cellulose binding domain